MARVITSPQTYTQRDLDGKTSLFLAGGVTGCPDWQTRVINQLKDYENLIIFNPRCTTGTGGRTVHDVQWEFEAMDTADIILFWFPKEGLCATSLYELGRINGKKHGQVFIGVHPNFHKAKEVTHQVHIARGQWVHTSLEDLLTAVKAQLSL